MARLSIPRGVQQSPPCEVTIFRRVHALQIRGIDMHRPGTSALHCDAGRAYPYADQLLERVAMGNKLIVVAVPNP
jgi:hypothetical protein